jgi:hypothetical protein
VVVVVVAVAVAVGVGVGVAVAVAVDAGHAAGERAIALYSGRSPGGSSVARCGAGAPSARSRVGGASAAAGRA